MADHKGEDWSRLNAEIYDLCSEVQQQILDGEDAGYSNHIIFVNAVTKLSFYVKQLEQELGV